MKQRSQKAMNILLGIPAVLVLLGLLLVLLDSVLYGIVPAYQNYSVRLLLLPVLLFFFAPAITLLMSVAGTVLACKKRSKWGIILGVAECVIEFIHLAAAAWAMYYGQGI